MAILLNFISIMPDFDDNQLFIILNPILLNLFNFHFDIFIDKTFKFYQVIILNFIEQMLIYNKDNSKI
jgi:hypothetical protein